MDEGPYRGYHADDFNTVKLDAPIRGAAPVTSTFDRPPVRVGAPAASYMTSNFDEAPVRMGPMHVDSQPATGEFNAPPVRTSPMSTTPMAPAGSPMQPSSAVPLKGGSNGFSSWAGLSKEWLLGDVILRVLTLVCAVVAVGLLAGFISKIDEVNAVSLSFFSTASPTYQVAIAALGILYSGFGSVVASIGFFSGKLILGDASHLIFYIGDQVFVCLFLTAGSAGASDLTALGCSDTRICGNGSGGVSMLLIAIAFTFGNLILSSISLYKRKT
ncbi:hypothetical protein GOP47_0021133 [Adiantum capillus-veneris]|uniref:CASP-like protein n=1 Tax=Adiantum capillus-veneris TaxID=13818 RepID=A0A9D4Z6T2_ADICA|nr:hypothetical protein GOP47_0021133 [Adiantum capillus-veneris]